MKLINYLWTIYKFFIVLFTLIAIRLMLDGDLTAFLRSPFVAGYATFIFFITIGWLPWLLKKLWCAA